MEDDLLNKTRFFKFIILYHFEAANRMRFVFLARQSKIAKSFAHI